MTIQMIQITDGIVEQVCHTYHRYWTLYPFIQNEVKYLPVSVLDDSHYAEAKATLDICPIVDIEISEPE